jgi:parallel beta-helix repeat protein
MPRLNFALLCLVLFLFAQPVFATTYYVGSCMKGAYATITAAVKAVPEGSTIDVCPGTYPEQIVIFKDDLTLQGITSGNSSSVVVTIPADGLASTTSITFPGVPFYAQVEANGASVRINNITVDGSASSNCPQGDLGPGVAGAYTGIFYPSGSSGIMNNVNTRHQSCTANDPAVGVGILAENGLGATQSVTIQNSNVRDQTLSGIVVCSTQDPPTLTVTIKNNNLDESVANGDGNGILVYPTCNVAGSISGNFIDGPREDQVGIEVGPLSNIVPAVSGNTVAGNGSAIGIYISANNAVVSSNTVLKEFDGIVINAGSGITVSSNRLLDNTYGIYLSFGSGANPSVTSNVITRNNIGIEVNCETPPTITGNVIDAATTGMDMVPASFSGTNSFYNVSTIRTGGC